MTTTNVSRLILPHPDLGTPGGVSLHDQVEAMYKKIGDNISTRILAATAVANGATVVFEHDFRAAFANMRYDLYLLTSTDPFDLARITSATSPSLSQFTIIANVTNPTKMIDVTNNSGSTQSFALVVVLDPLFLKEGDIKDVDVTTVPPEDGQAMVYDATAGAWKPGASGDSSFKLQSIVANVVTIKKGFLKDSLGKLLGIESDLTANLKTAVNTAGVISPSASITYWLYIDTAILSTTAIAASTSGFASVLYYLVTSGTSGSLIVSATAPESIDLTRYYPLGPIKTDGSSNYTEKLDYPSKTIPNSLSKALTKVITQAAHGFTSSDVGSPVYKNASSVYVKAKADTSATAEISGLISGILDVNRFTVTNIGEVTVNTAVSGGGALVVGSVYFLSAATAGAITATEPSVSGQVSKPLGLAISTTVLMFMPVRGSVVGGANFRTLLSLANNAATTIQNASAYDAGEVAGWVTIAATTPLKFYFQAQFAKNGAGTDYNLAYQSAGDAEPVGFSVSITSGGLVQINLPSITGFASATVNFALNAPAVGVTVPLMLDGLNLTEKKNLTVYTGAATAALDGTSLHIGNSASPFTLGIASAVGNDGLVMSFKNIGAGAVTLDPNASETIDGVATLLLGQNATVELIARSGNWVIRSAPFATSVAAGLVISGRTQLKVLSSTIAGSSTPSTANSDLSFNNLIAGRTYRLDYSIETDTAPGQVWFIWGVGSDPTKYRYVGSPTGIAVTGSIVFIAVNSTLNVYLGNGGANYRAADGNSPPTAVSGGSPKVTWTQLTEQPFVDVTSAFT